MSYKKNKEAALKMWESDNSGFRHTYDSTIEIKKGPDFDKDYIINL